MKPLTYRERVELRVAAADQQHFLGRMMGEMGPLGSWGNSHQHPWLKELPLHVLRKMARDGLDVCPHVLKRPQPMHTTLMSGPVRILCRLCLVTKEKMPNAVDSLTCDRCSVYSHRGLICGTLPLTNLLLTFGVCEPCGTELGIATGVPA